MPTTLSYTTYRNEAVQPWIIFLHGLGGNYQIFNKQIEPFRAHYNLLFINLPGHGQSPYRKTNNLLSTTSKQVIDVLNAEKIPSAHFLGVSLGTVIMQQIAMEYPDRIKSMVLAGAAGKWLKWGEWIGRLAISFPFRYILPYMLPYTIFAHILMPKPNHSKSRNIFLQEARKLGKPAYLGWTYVIRDSYKVYEQLRENLNTIPKLYVSGAEDHMFLKGIQNHVKLEAKAKLHTIPHCGHVCNIEEADIFNGLALEFLEQVGKEEEAYWGVS
ncbi:alpha/beta fold hydrolase [Pontibacillus litoralis]|uniref:AB hydrolase-1 domain-containing protein n=1 Tax=Pontibacillus litoralis JSM 072002 TaxID=1385512 RepID=A0A0A5G2T8_9BACI|nr:alpha/beta hydrolase [Pontibacillus litoralis]KGX86359.1 hypothetical protein N784_05255 [Pontibacillus litoralis JSM 072002]